MSVPSLQLPAAPGDKPPQPEDDVHLTLMEHLEELRKRLKRMIVWVLAGFALCYHWSEKIFAFMMQPVLASLPDGQKSLHFSSSVEPFMMYLKVGLYAGLFAASPGLLYELWSFIAPGLYRREKKAIAPFVAASVLMFLGGAAFCYLVILPPAFHFLLIDAVGPDVTPILMMSDQLGLVMTLLLAFGIVFEIPLVLTSLSMLGLVDWRWLAKYRRHAIIVNVIIAAVVTPTGDPFNLALMAVPMILCYELGVLGARVFAKKPATAT